MNYDYLSKIRANIALYTNKMTSNVLDGEFKSIFRGRSLDFDDLREYSYGDNVKDIDWKSSSKTGKILVRRYVAYRKHNILFVGDSGVKFTGDTMTGQKKSQVALTACGTIAYLVDRHGDDFALLTSVDDGYDFSFFNSGGAHFEHILTDYEKYIVRTPKYAIDDVLEYAAEQIKRKMVIVLITDIEGLSKIDEPLIRKLTVNNDVLCVNITDAYMHGDNVYDVDRKRYEDRFILRDSRLFAAEKKLKDRITKQADDLFTSYGATMVSMSSEEEIVDKVALLFERHKNETHG
ncbi:MAG: DUF58 domain-containing protein [Lachnospiraceae bacterium]|nr:DUF58 domain-containing protein [Lachnospiraceae bacterium]